DTRFADDTTAHRTFDAWGHATGFEARSESGSIIGSSTLGLTPSGRLESITASVDAGVSRQTAVRWDGAGRTTAVASGNRAARASFDTAGRLVASKVGEGSLAEITTPFLSQQITSHVGTLPLLATTAEKTGSATNVLLQYDTAANITSEQVGGLEWRQAFDQTGSVTSAALPSRPGSSFAYDARAALTQQTLPDGSTNKYAYKPNGALDAYTDPSGESALTLDTNLLGWPLKRTYADGTSEQLSYDGPRLKTFTNRQGVTQVFSYNGKGQLTRIDRLGGGQLGQFDYDDAGRLVRSTNKDASLFFTDFNLAGLPKKTTLTRYKDSTGLTSVQILATYTQEHAWNEHGERVEWTMPRPSGFTTSAPWTDRVRQQYDAMGNLVGIDRQLFGATIFTPFFSADYRSVDRPNTRSVITHCGTTCAPATILREYGYDPANALLNDMSVRVGTRTVAGSRVTTFDGIQVATVQLHGLTDAPTNTWDYDDRGRVTSVTAGRMTTEDLSPSDFRRSATREPRLSDSARAAITAKGGNPDLIDPPTLNASELANTGHAIATITRGTTTRSFSFLGGFRTDDGRFEYEWDEKGRLLRATEKIAAPAADPLRMRVSYAWDGGNRMVGRKVEVASISSPTDWQLASPAILTDGLPADATFVWDPLSDRIAAVFDAITGALVRQVIHGGLRYDDPVEITLTDPANASAPLQRLYPIYDEAAAGTLQAVLNMDGEVVSRTVVGDMYGDDRSSIAGAAIDRIAISTTKASDGSLQSVHLTLHATEELRESSVAAGARLAALDAAGNVIRTSAAPPLLTDPATITFTLSAADWTTLTAGATLISVGVTPELRAVAWGENVPILPAPAWATIAQSVQSSPELPVEQRDSVSYLSSWLASISPGAGGTLPLYEVDDLGLLGSPVEDDDPARFILASPLHALPFFDSVTRLSLARERWLDHETGTFLSVEPLGFVDSANRYSYAAGDPVNGRDPTGELCERANAAGWWDWAKRCSQDVGWVAEAANEGITAPKNIGNNLQRAAGGVVSTGKLVGGAVRTVLWDLPTASVNDAAADRFVAAGQSIGNFVSHPIDTTISAHEAMAANVLRHEQQGEYVASGEAAASQAQTDFLVAYSAYTLGSATLSRLTPGVAIEGNPMAVHRLAETYEAMSGGGSTGSAAAAGGGALVPLAAAYHYTYSQYAQAIAEGGLRPGSYATPRANLSPLQAQLELALSPERGLPQVRLQIDLAGLRSAGYEIPGVTRASNTVTAASGRVYTMPGGGYQMQFLYRILPEFIKVVP
ncbi:MAG: RHS repeat-associated core domain-containing protein, partial [Acidobacteriota bacterium]